MMGRTNYQQTGCAQS